MKNSTNILILLLVSFSPIQAYNENLKHFTGQWWEGMCLWGEWDIELMKTVLNKATRTGEEDILAAVAGVNEI